MQGIARSRALQRSLQALLFCDSMQTLPEGYDRLVQQNDDL